MTNEECATFYRTLSTDMEDHLLSGKRIRVEHQLECHAMPFELPQALDDMFETEIKLYVRRAFAKDAREELMRDFAKGIVASEVLLVKISRETLHQQRNPAFHTEESYEELPCNTRRIFREKE